MITARLKDLQTQLTSLNLQARNLSGPVLEPSHLSRIKRNYLTGKSVPLGLNTREKKHSKGSIQLTPKKDHLEVQIVIEDSIDQPTDEMQYQITNVNFNHEGSFGFGVLYLNDGQVSIVRVQLEYTNQTQTYLLKIGLENSFLHGRILIVANFNLKLEEFYITPVILESVAMNDPKPIPEKESLL